MKAFPIKQIENKNANLLNIPYTLKKLIINMAFMKYNQHRLKFDAYNHNKKLPLKTLSIKCKIILILYVTLHLFIFVFSCLSKN